MLDEGKSKRFHIDFLGYETEWEHRSHADNPDALYTQVRQGGRASPEWTCRYWIVKETSSETKFAEQHQPAETHINVADEISHVI